MILDELIHSTLVHSLDSRIAIGFDFLRSLGGSLPSEWPEGPRDIEDGVYAVVARRHCRAVEEAKLEVHDSYLDLHCLFSGREGLGWKARYLCKHPIDVVDKRSDVFFYDDKPEVVVPLLPGRFALCFPQDAHMPLIGDGWVEKIIVKIPFSDHQS